MLFLFPQMGLPSNKQLASSPRSTRPATSPIQYTAIDYFFLFFATAWARTLDPPIRQRVGHMIYQLGHASVSLAYLHA
jgi:hypothetical protein